MKKEVLELRDSPDFATLKEAAEIVGMNAVTFRKYASRLGINGYPISKYTFYRKEDVEKVKKLMVNQVPLMVSVIENFTGKIVRLEEKK